MMLVESTLPSSINDHGKQESSCVWIHGDGAWQEPTNVVPVIEHKNKDDSLWSRNLLSSSQLSTEVDMFETSKPNFVYKRRTIRKNLNVCDLLPRDSRSTPTLVYKRRKVQSDNSKSGSVGDEVIEEPKSKMKTYSGLHAVNDSCSSSKSNIDLGSGFVKHQVDDTGECSSSGVVIMEGSNSCFSFLTQHGVLERLKTTKKQASVNNNIFCLKACKVCDRSTSTLNMLICDLCEESFHVSCCNSVKKKVPATDWFCHFCSRKQLKKTKETNSRKSPKDCLGPIASMLRDTDPYTSNVRIGKDFQVKVPDWSGPLSDERKDYLKLIELSTLDCASYQVWDSSKLSRLGCIGNWLQCREEVDDDGTICGKWRRAPLFEVQTDNWECFCSVLWDPTHADCAVPQELNTDQVLKQLKHIEMLRPQLSAKRWKKGVNKGINQQEHTTDPKNLQKS